MHKTFKVILLGILALLILSACQTTSTPNPTKETETTTPTLDHGEQTPITLDEQFVQVAEQMDNFAGMYYDENGELNVAVATTDLSPQSLATQAATAKNAIAEVFGEDVLLNQPSEAQLEALSTGGDLALQSVAAPEENFKIVPVTYSFQQLLDWFKAIETTIWGIEGVNALDIDELNNLIVIGADDQATIGEIENELSSLEIPENAVLVEVEGAVDVLANLDRHNRPLRGGLGISRSGGRSTWQCTLGFNAIRKGIAGFVTNAHCTSNQGTVNFDRYYQGSNRQIGYEIAEAPMWTSGSYRYRWADVAFVRFLNSPSYSLGGIAITNFAQRNVLGTRYINYKSNPIVGQYIYKVGVTTGTTSGRVTRTCVDTRQNGTNIINKCQSWTKSNTSYTISRPGDSGSPVYMWRYVSNVGWKIELKGILWGGGGRGSKSTMVFSPIRNVQYSLGTLRVHNYQKVGDYLKVTLRYVKVHDDCDGVFAGAGDMFGYFNIEGSRVYTYSNKSINTGGSLGIWRNKTVRARYDNPISIYGIMKDSDIGPDDWVGRWNLNLNPVPSAGYFSSYSKPECSSTLYYRIEDVGNTYE